MALHVYTQGMAPITPNIIKGGSMSFGNTNITQTSGTVYNRNMVIWIPTNGETTFRFEWSNYSSTCSAMYVATNVEPAIGATVGAPTTLSGSSPFTITIPSGRTYLAISMKDNSLTDLHNPIYKAAKYKLGNPNSITGYWDDGNINSEVSGVWGITKALQEYTESGNNIDITGAFNNTMYTINVSTKQINTGTAGVQPIEYWPITPGDTVAFKYTNNSGRTVINYTDSSITLQTGYYYWFVSTLAKNTTIQPMTDLHTETINGETYYVFTVPTGMTYLAIGYTYGSGSYDPKDNIVATILYRGTVGWIH